MQTFERFFVLLSVSTFVVLIALACSKGKMKIATEDSTSSSNLASLAGKVEYRSSSIVRSKARQASGGLLVELFKLNGTKLAETIADSEGAYQFEGMEPGQNYLILATLPTGARLRALTPPVSGILEQNINLESEATVLMVEMFEGQDLSILSNLEQRRLQAVSEVEQKTTRAVSTLQYIEKRVESGELISAEDISALKIKFETKPEQVTGLLVYLVESDNQVLISWDSMPGADAYQVYLADDGEPGPATYQSLPGGKKQQVTGFPELILNSGEYNPKGFYVSVSAINSKGEGAVSSVKAWTPTKSDGVDLRVEQRPLSQLIVPLDQNGEELAGLTVEQAERLRIQLFDDLVYTASLTRSERPGEGRFMWSGKVDGHDMSSVVLAFHGDACVGMVKVPEKGAFRISYKRDSNTCEVRLLGDALRKCNPISPDFDHVTTGFAPNMQAAPGDGGDDGWIVDVLFVYTPAAKTAAGGTHADVQSIVDASVGHANLSYVNSGVTMRVRSVHVEEVSYTEVVGDLSTDLSRLKETGDSHIDNVHTLRTQYGADVVCLLIYMGDDFVSGTVGLAYIMDSSSIGSESAFSSWAFNVCSIDHSVEGTFTHELGHNLGCAHNTEDAGGGGGYVAASSYGYRIASKFKTVMSYGSDSTYPPIDYFSTPNKTYNGDAVGTATANNAATLNATYGFGANWVASRVPSIETDQASLTIIEGTTATLKIRMSLQNIPNITVNASLSSEDSDLAILSADSFVFTYDDWNQWKSVTIGALPDVDTTNGSVTLTLSATGLDSVTITVSESDTSVAGDPVLHGSVFTSSGAGVQGATITLSNGGGTAVTDENGMWSTSVSSGWYGTMTPSLTGYSFSPTSQEIASGDAVTSYRAVQPFTAEPPPVIMGHVLNAKTGKPIAGVTVTASGGEGSDTTDSEGYYEIMVSDGWSGTLTPSKGDISFSPSSLSVSNISADSEGNDFLGTNMRIYVAADASDGGDGTSWSEAYNDLSDAIAEADDGAEIWMKEGTYTPGSAATNKWTIASAISIYGSFAGTESATSERNIENHPTILSGDSVTYQLVELNAAVDFDGLTFQNAGAQDQWPNDSGAAVFVYETSANFTKCKFKNLSAASNGGAIYAYGLTAEMNFTDCLFLSNTADVGGAIYVYIHQDINFLRCRFIQNSAGRSSEDNGGGFLYMSNNSANKTAGYKVSFINCMAYDSSCASGLGGFIIGLTDKLEMTNCSLHVGVASIGGFVFGNSLDVTVENSVFGYCSASNFADGFYLDAGSSMSVSYTVFDSATVSGSITPTQSNNLSSAASFENELGDDNTSYTEDDSLALASGSPGIDAANSGATNYPSTDIDGNARVDDSGTANTGAGGVAYADMGAFEFGSTSSEVSTPGITLTTSSLTLDEDGGSLSFSVVLDAEPASDVVLHVSSSDADEATVSPSTLTFTAANWDTAQEVTVTGVNDDAIGTHTAVVTISVDAASSDDDYDAVSSETLTFSLTDDDGASITVSETSLSIVEGGTGAFTVVLDVAPSSDVVMNVTSDDTDIVTVSAASLTFTSANWNTPQTVTVTGVDDSSMSDGSSAVKVSIVDASSDNNFDGIADKMVSISVTNSDIASYTVSSQSFDMDEGDTATFTVVLDVQPTTQVTFTLTPEDSGILSVSPSSLTFTNANWNTAQTVTLTAVDNDTLGNELQRPNLDIDTDNSDDDWIFAGGTQIAATITDDDVAGFTLSVSTVSMTEGGTGSFTVVLNAEPNSNVTLNVLSSDETEATSSADTLTFTSTNWNTPQTVTITAVEDASMEDDTASIMVSVDAMSSDGNFMMTPSQTISLTISNNDSSSFSLSSSTLSVNEGDTATFTVVLSARPTNDVVFTITSSDTDNLTVEPATLTFTNANYDTPQTITVLSPDDEGVGSETILVTVSVDAANSDDEFDSLDAQTVTVLTIDDEAAGFTVTDSSVTIDEDGGTYVVGVVLNAQPQQNVIITLSCSDIYEATLEYSSLTFTADNWDAMQTFTITGVDDDYAVTDTAVVTLSVSGVSDSSFAQIEPSTLALTLTNDDTAGITLTGNTMTINEDGGTGSFSVKLDASPTSSVKVLISNDTDETTISAPGMSSGTITFTEENWDMGYPITVKGIDDVRGSTDVDSIIVSIVTGESDQEFSEVASTTAVVTLVNDDTVSFTVSPILMTISENEGSDELSVSLGAAPASAVVLDLVSEIEDEVTLSASQLTFTEANWQTAQTVTVTGVDDNSTGIDYTTILVSVNADESDDEWDNLDSEYSLIKLTNDDAAGYVLSSTSITVSEDMTMETVTLTLAAKPSSDVVVPVTSDDTSEAIVAPASSSLTFTPDNWNVAQDIRVAGYDDDLADGTQSITVTIGPATTSDPDFAAAQAATLYVDVTDNDQAGITVYEAPSLSELDEDGDFSTFVIELDGQPSDDVTLAIASSDTSEAVVSPAIVTFTPDDYDSVIVTVTAVDDDFDDGDVSVTISIGAASSNDTAYNGINPQDITVTVIDDDVAGASLSPLALTVKESGTSAEFTVSLSAAPVSSVTFPVVSNDTGEVTASVASIIFTYTNWDTPQTVTVTGVDDDVADGDQDVTVYLGAATSSDSAYSNMMLDDAVTVTIEDDELTGFTVSQPSSNVSETGSTATFTVVLTAEPYEDVIIPILSQDTGEGTVSPASLTFTSANWNIPQTVTVTGVDDSVEDGSTEFTIELGAAISNDDGYGGQDPEDVVMICADDDTAGISLSATSLSVTEGGTTATFTVVLNTQSTDTVTLNFDSSDTSEATVSPTSLTFTPANWNTAQTVTVSAVDDSIDDDATTANVVFTASSSNDENYDGIIPSQIAINITDNDDAGITVSRSGSSLSEAGGSQTISVVLLSEPTANVSIAVASSDTGEATVSSASLTFTPANWNVTQTITVSGVDEDIDDGNQNVTVTLGSASSGDGSYNGMALSPSQYSFSVTDNDTAGVLVSAGILSVLETGTSSTFTVVLQSEPTQTVSLNFDPTDESEVSVSPGVHTFTSANWNTPVTITVYGEDDDVDDGTVTSKINIGFPLSSDTKYAAIDPSDITVLTYDDDTFGVTISALSSASVSETGTTATFTMRLNSEPTHSVKFAIASSDTSEATVSVSSVTFTADNWENDQTITITGIDDEDDDGDRTVAISIGAAVSSDAKYSGLDLDDKTITVIDDEITITGTVQLDGGEKLSDCLIRMGDVSFLTTSAGTFFFTVEAPFTGSLWAEMTGYGFSPATHYFTALSEDVSRTFTATKEELEDFRFSWAAVAGAQYYKLYVTKSNTLPVEIAINKTSITTTYYEPEEGELENGVEYSWFVRAWLGSSWNSWTPERRFIIGTVEDNTGTITWDAVGGATKYRLFLANVTTNTVLVDDDNIAGTSYDASGVMTANHEHTYFFMSYDGTEWSHWLAPVTFTYKP